MTERIKLILFLAQKGKRMLLLLPVMLISNFFPAINTESALWQIAGQKERATGSPALSSVAAALWPAARNPRLNLTSCKARFIVFADYRKGNGKWKAFEESRKVPANDHRRSFPGFPPLCHSESNSPPLDD